MTERSRAYLAQPPARARSTSVPRLTCATPAWTRRAAARSSDRVADQPRGAHASAPVTLGHGGRPPRGGERGVYREHRARRRILDLVGEPGVRDDPPDERRGGAAVREQRDDVAVALAHLAAVEA